MSKTKDMSIDENNHKYFLIEQDNFFQTLNYYYQKDHPEDNTLERYFYCKQELIRILENENRWRYTKPGFFCRTNFKYNPQDKEITYRVNLIKRNNNGYYVDETSTPLSIEYYNRNTQFFIELAKVERLINSIYLQYKPQVDRIILLTKEGRKSMKEIDPEVRKRLKLCTSPIHHDKLVFIKDDFNDINRFIHLYQKDGLKRLIRWLNALSSTDDLDTIYNAYIEEMAPFTFIPEKEDKTDAKKMAIATYLPRLLKMIKMYSVRGETLYNKYQLEEQQRKNTTPSNNI